MDLVTATPPPAVSAERASKGDVGSRLFVEREEESDGLEQLGGSPGGSDHPPAKTIHPRRALVLLACGVCCAGLLAYGVRSRLNRHHQPSSTFTFALPPAASAAAVKALPPPNLLKPLSPSQASQQNVDRPFTTRPDSPASRFLLKADAQDQARALTCLAQAVYYEAAGEGVDGQRAVAQVVLNRVRHPGFPSTICGVVYEGSDRTTGCQFSFTCDGSMQHIPLQWLWTRSKQIAEQALKGRVFAPVGHATHYHADYVVPYWADSLDKSVQIGRHIFYRLRNSFGDPRAFSQRYGGTEPPFREPGTTVMIAQSPETQQLSNALITDAAKGAPQRVEMASPAPSSPLLIDTSHSTLRDNVAATVRTSAREKPIVHCSGSAEQKQITALKADDLRASAAEPSC